MERYCRETVNIHEFMDEKMDINLDFEKFLKETIREEYSRFSMSVEPISGFSFEESTGIMVQLFKVFFVPEVELDIWNDIYVILRQDELWHYGFI